MSIEEPTIKGALKHLNTIYVKKYTGFGWICKYCKDIKVFEDIMKRKDLNINIQNQYGYTALMYLCFTRNKNVEIYKLFLDREDLDINLQDNYGDTALMNLCVMGSENMEIWKLFLDRKDLDINIQNEYGDTVLMRLCYSGNEKIEIFKLFLDREDLSLSIKNYIKETALDLLKRFKQIKYIELLEKEMLCREIMEENRLMRYNYLRMESILRFCLNVLQVSY